MGASSRLKREFILRFDLRVTEGVQMHSGASGAPHRCASKSSSFFFFFFYAPGLSLSDGFGGGAARGPDGTSQESAVAAEQIGEQTVTLGHSRAPLSGEPESSGGGR